MLLVQVVRPCLAQELRTGSKFVPEKELGLQRLDVAESATVMSLFENVQREDLNPLEVAQDLQYLVASSNSRISLI